MLFSCFFIFIMKKTFSSILNWTNAVCIQFNNLLDGSFLLKYNVSSYVPQKSETFDVARREFVAYLGRMDWLFSGWLTGWCLSKSGGERRMNSSGMQLFCCIANAYQLQSDLSNPLWQKNDDRDDMWRKKKQMKAALPSSVNADSSQFHSDTDTLPSNSKHIARQNECTHKFPFQPTDNLIIIILMLNPIAFHK